MQKSKFSAQGGTEDPQGPSTGNTAEGILNPDTQEVHSPPQADLDVAIEFIRKFCGDLASVITAITPKSGVLPKIITKSFRAYEMPACREFIAELVNSHNIYFSVNPTRSVVTKKPSKEEIHSVCWFHVDIDPDKDKALAEEQARILNRIKAFSPKPSMVVFSGSGFQCFWRLRDPILVKGRSKEERLASAENLEDINKRLAKALGGDACHNLDRIMRLPGTLNHKFNPPVLAKVVNYDE